jgi:Spy/CpxP family protein refolding chaperone
LSLTSSQQEQAKTIFDAEDIATKPLMAALQLAQSALATADKQGQSDSALEQLADAVGACFGNLAAANAKAERQFYAILTPDQQTKCDKLATFGFAAPAPMPREGQPF